MGIDSRTHTPVLPAPTDFTTTAPSDVGTSFSIPEDGREIHIAKPRGHTPSHQSLLIEYYEGGRSSKSGGPGRPTVRVKVRPSSKGAANLKDAVKITQRGQHDQPVLVKEIPLDRSDTRVQLGGKEPRQDFEPQAVAGSELTHSSGSHLSARPPIEIEVRQNSSDISSGNKVGYNASEISSIPADSMLDAPLTFKEPSRRRSRSLERSGAAKDGLLKAPVDDRSRSLSRERIAQRVLEKLHADNERDSSGRRRLQRVKDKGGRELVEADLKERSRRSSSKSHGGSESSHRYKEVDSNLSATSKSSVNNPKMIAAVEEAIKRLILPEIQSLKRNQASSHRRNRDSLTSDYSSSRTDPSRRESRTSTNMTRSKLADTELLPEGSPRRKERRRSSHTESERSMDTVDREKRQERARERERSSRSSTKYRAQPEGLTAAALKTHNIHDREREEMEQRAQDKGTGDDYYEDDDHIEAAVIPPMPLAGQQFDSELTRESLLSDKTDDMDDARTERPYSPLITPVREVSRGNPLTISLPQSRSASRADGSPMIPESRPTTRQTVIRASSTTPTPMKRDRRISSAESSKTELSIKTKAKRAGLAAAGLSGSGAAVAALYERPRHRDIDERSVTSRQSHRSERRSSAAAEVSGKQQDGIRDDVFAQALAAKGISSEHLLSAEDEDDADTTDDFDRFQAEQHQLNEHYRTMNDNDSRPLTSSAMESTSSITERDIKESGDRGIIQTPYGIESNVASIVNTSGLGSERSAAPSARYGGLHGHDGSSLASNTTPTKQRGILTQHSNDSASRWGMLRETARAASLGSRETSPEKRPQLSTHTQEDAISQSSQDQMYSTPLLERGTGSDEALTRKTQVEHAPSWPITSDPQALAQLGARNEPRDSSEDTTPVTELHHDIDSRSGNSSVEDVQRYDGAADRHPYSHHPNVAMHASTPAGLRDEGYMSGAQNNSQGHSPIDFNRSPPKLFADVDLGRPSPNLMPPGKAMTGPRIRHQREVSHDRQFVARPMPETSMNIGKEDIESRDIVALMDHLSARDGQRNARDTEILVTLVRSATEMRESFDNMKRFIELQNDINMRRTDADAEKTVNKILSGPRPPPSSAEVGRTSVDMAEPTKKSNIFKRALKGLGGKSPQDLSRIESMLEQLLDEVDAIREAQDATQQNNFTQSTPWPSRPKASSLGSYEKLRAVPTDQIDNYREQDAASALSQGQTMDASMRPRPNRLATSYQTAPQSPQSEDDDLERTPTQERPDPLNSHRVQPNDSLQMSPEEKQRKHASEASSFIPVVSRWSKTTTSTARDSRYSNGQYSAADLEAMRRQIPRSRSPSLSEKAGSPDSPASGPKYRANRNSLTLEHPQPRQGSTGRHQSNLETQANTFQAPNHSPLLTTDVFGSNPNLLLPNRSHPQLGGGQAAALQAAEPAYSNSIYQSQPHKQDTASNAQQQYDVARAPQRYQGSPEIRPIRWDSPPDSPPEDWQDTSIPLEERVGRYQPGDLLNPIEERYSMEGDRSSLGYKNSVKSNRGHRGSFHEAQMSGDHGSRRTSQVGMADVREEDEEDVPRDSGYVSGVPKQYILASHQQQPQQGEQHYQAYSHQQQQQQQQQPYQHLPVTQYPSNTNDRSSTPRASPRPALGAADAPLRKLTGPREMPGAAAGRSSPMTAGAGLSPRIARAVPKEPLRGTIRRKPMA